MKFLSFLHSGQPKFGIYDESKIIDLTGKIDGARSLKELIANNNISKAKNFASKSSKSIGIKEIEFLPVIPDPGKIVCVGLNYSEHVEETGRKLEKNPVIFFRVSDSQTAHNSPIKKPKVSNHLDFECEMAVIMNNTEKHIKEENALKNVVGYSCYNDSTVRDWQQHTSQFGMGKNFESTGSFGPHMVLSEDILDYKKLEIQTRLNGKIMQKAKLSQLIFDLPFLISYISKAIPWKAGDVLVTGTPGGVGFKRNPPIYMKDGDKVEVEISKIGILSNYIMEETN
ncbi:MAG: 5-carboxymethyl-2-hydroxymuconate isomerase [Candidatus Marinimicrobia bacterium]|nr:5-carboxymethyl-2-hydroxymuconate isomerase [Candidatus Neomarinimicrobiota bacterium]|tara:strand:+ start:3842 stop:4693 length:852 start_codon:yes stop_codon:yes gene_type:complete